MLFLRINFIFLLSFSFLFASGGCFKYFPGSFKIINTQRAYAIAKNRWVSMKCPAGKKIISQDRLKGVCLFEDKTIKPLYVTPAKSPLVFCPSNPIKHVKIIEFPKGINPGKLMNAPHIAGAIFSPCCKLSGITDAFGNWFGAKTIFSLLHGNIHHGDVGARFLQKGSAIRVVFVNPYVHSPFLPGDVITSVKRVKHPKFGEFLNIVDRCTIGKAVPFTVVRDKRKIDITAMCRERFGGGKLSDTFLEKFGIWFDKKLFIKQIDPNGMAYKLGLRKHDRLLRIDSHDVNSDKEIRELLTTYFVEKNMPKNILIERNGFQFFLPIRSL